MENITIKEVNKLTASDGEEYDYFGRSVAVSSDGLVAIVGGYGSNSKAIHGGKVYTYSRDSITDNWKEVNQLVASDSNECDYFGRSVALSDNGLVCIVGAHHSSTKAYTAGKVYTYSRATIDDNWKEVNQLVTSDSEEFDFFGSSVALSSDGLVAIVGAYGSSTKAINAGKVYTYSRDTINDNWTEVNQLVASDGEARDYFGSAIAISADGLIAMVGAFCSVTKAGKVYTYSRDTINDDWTEVNQLVASDSKAYDNFGVSVTLSGDGLVAIVGGYGRDTKGSAIGKVYTYNRATINDNWVEVNQLIASDGKKGDYFGCSVALSSNGLIATVCACGSDTNTGKVYTYSRNSINDNWTEVNQLTANNGIAYDNFGNALALSEDSLTMMIGDSIDDKVYTYNIKHTPKINHN